jgi:Fe2+ transport system protein FeoA
MGLTSGAVIDVVKLSPLGDPVEYRLRGYHLSLRSSEARTIEVEVLGDSAKPLRLSGHFRSNLSLVRCRDGQQVEIVRVRGGRNMSQRLRELGLIPGSIYRVIRNDFPGPLILADPEGERVVVGKGMARHIFVKVI